MSPTTTTTVRERRRRKLLLLHGSHQTGQLLLGRVEKLRKRLLKGIQTTTTSSSSSIVEWELELVAPDAPFAVHHPGNDDDNDGVLRQWWERRDNACVGLKDTMQQLTDLWNANDDEDDDHDEKDTSQMDVEDEEDNNKSGSGDEELGDDCDDDDLFVDFDDRAFCGVIGFSQGARLAHLMAVCHHRRPTDCFPGLQFVILVAGYDAPLPDGFDTTICPLLPLSSQPNNNNNDNDNKIRLFNLHIWGKADKLILPEQSRQVCASYDPSFTTTHVHEGGHHVPMKAENLGVIESFLQTSLQAAAAAAATTSTQQQDSSLLKDTNQTGDASTTTTLFPSLRSTTTDTATKSPAAAAAAQPGTNTQPQSQKQQQLPPAPPAVSETPDKEHAQLQLEEIEALLAIFPDEFTLLSSKKGDDEYDHPICYKIVLPPNKDGIWPSHRVAVHVQYTPKYPDALPILTLWGHQNNSKTDLTPLQYQACMLAMTEAAKAEGGMPCVLSIVNMARDFFESGAMALTGTSDDDRYDDSDDDDDDMSDDDDDDDDESDDYGEQSELTRCLPDASAERISECNLEGLQIAEILLGLNDSRKNAKKNSSESASTTTATTATVAGGDLSSLTTTTTTMASLKGGSWAYTIGLVGKPSAGKSTFFNAATAFARQRNDTGNARGGAAMAPHPFTTIDPNIGVCWIPAPPGSCPEETYYEQHQQQGNNNNNNNNTKWVIGSTHGRDHKGQRLIPVLLKDVAGLVPGAYQGRGRGNKFLNDLTDADVLIHVLDVSGTADSEGNYVGQEDDGTPCVGASHPLSDLAWIRNELIEWVFTNLLYKWDTIRRKGRSKLTDMFSGYGQSQAMTWNVLNAVEKYTERKFGLDHALDRLDKWDTGDVHRLVSAFLGVRFPMALAMNKYDMPTSAKHSKDIQEALPIHGAHAAVALCAKSEMQFMQQSVESTLKKHHHSGRDADRRKHALSSSSSSPSLPSSEGRIPAGVWECLQLSLKLREPILVFPVVDMKTYAPLPGMTNYATSDPSLPNAGMIACLQAAKGSPPSLWDASTSSYATPSSRGGKNSSSSNSSTTTSTATTTTVALRDCLVMKPGSTVEDVYLTLKRLGALSGEFVRAEGCGELGSPAKPVPKQQLLTKSIRILKVMTNKRTSWQNK